MSYFSHKAAPKDAEAEGARAADGGGKQALATEKRSTGKGPNTRGSGSLDRRKRSGSGDGIGNFRGSTPALATVEIFGYIHARDG